MANNDKFKAFLVTGLGTGYMPIAPGTWGSAAAAAVYVVAAWASGYSCMAVNTTLVVMGVIASIICVAFGDFAEKRFGKKDPGAVTTDEWAGQALTMLALPMATGLVSALLISAAAFFSFRFFDIVKIPPARQFERLPKGVGVLVDDLAAAVYANIACQILIRWQPAFFGL